MKDEKKNKISLDDLIELMARLRGDGGCPWDREQTPESLTPYIIEEACELVDAVKENDPDHVREELGDLLFQIVFQARIGSERGDFDLYDVIEGIHRKMVRRHPHVFGDTRVRDSGDVKRNWVRIKESEGKKRPKGALGKVPRSLPALLRARRLTENASEVGFDWTGPTEVMAKFEEEWEEFELALSSGDPDRIEDEFGDVLFVLVNLSRFIKQDPEAALNRAIGKFTRRFGYIEDKVEESGRKMEDLTLDEMEQIWKRAKAEGV